MISQYFLGFSAGGLSLLAPCVLPLLPLIINSSLRSSKWGPLLSALGLTLSFTIFGILTSTFASIFDPDIIRNVGAVILVLVSLIILLPFFKNASSSSFQKLSDLGFKIQNKLPQNNPVSEFLAGGLLGLIWSPCTGPTLGLAIGLASKAENLFHASLIFFFFGLGAGLGLITLGYLIKRFVFLKSKLLTAGKAFNVFAGVLSFIIGILILTGAEAQLQEAILKALPESLIRFSTKF